MSITLTTLRSQVRDMADLDETDLSDSLLTSLPVKGSNAFMR
jgi:hypothetical protein